MIREQWRKHGIGKVYGRTFGESFPFHFCFSFLFSKILKVMEIKRLSGGIFKNLEKIHTLCFFWNAPKETYISPLLSIVASCGLHHWKEHEKLFLSMFFSDINIHHEIALPHRQQKHWNIYSQKLAIFFSFQQISQGSADQLIDNYEADQIMTQICSKVCPINVREAP